MDRRPRLFAIVAVSLGAAIVAASSAAGEPRTIYAEPIYPGEIVEERLAELLPADAADYAANYRACLHWSGEEAYSQERGDEIEAGIEASCTGLDSIRVVLSRKYPRGSRVDSTLQRIVADIDSGSEGFVWDDPRRESRVLDRYWEAWAQWTARRVDELIGQRTAVTDTTRESIRAMLRTQTDAETRYLGQVLANGARLHPDTVGEVRAAIARWERETGEMVPRGR